MPLTEAYVRSRIKAVREQALKAAFPADFTMADLKTVQTFRKELRKLVRRLYAGEINELDFTAAMSVLVVAQLNRAWNVGGRDIGFNMRYQDRDDEFLLTELIDGQANHVLEFTEAIAQARLQETPIDALLARGDLWANRFIQVENDARVHFGNRIVEVTSEIKEREGRGESVAGLLLLLLGGAVVVQQAMPRLVWRLGRTEEHCDTCATLHNTVATVVQWGVSGLRPQNAPNERLECGGWRCDCSLSPTDDPLTEGGIPSV